MSGTGVFRCCDDLRVETVRAQTKYNGIEWLEVMDHDAPTDAERQRILRVHFVNAPAPAGIKKENVVIEGGERVRNIAPEGDPTYDGDVLVVRVIPRGDFSPYTLRLVNVAFIDPPLSSIDFSFKVDCPSDFDCRVDAACVEPPPPAPHIDYLAKDYASFRRLMLDRLSLLLPGWRERTAADLGVTLVELLAYVGDALSYQQDAAATEAYLGTARLRTSVRRHARLIDYRMHDGCNARVFVQVFVTAPLALPKSTKLFTKIEGVAGRIADPSKELDQALAKHPVFFETLHQAQVDPSREVMQFYAWQSRNCCLPRGATRATLSAAKGRPKLARGDLVLFREVLGPRTGDAADADPAHRHVVHLTFVDNNGIDALTGVPITEIGWGEEDALPFPLCISATTDQRHKEIYNEDVSLAYGNIVLADHGLTIKDEPLGTVPEPALFRPTPDTGDACAHGEPVAVIPRFRPRLDHGPLTQQGRSAQPSLAHPDPLPFDPQASAAAAMRWKIDDVLPSIGLHGTRDGIGSEWEAHADLFESDPSDAHFVAEVEDDGIATIRFGDDDYGERPTERTAFLATYRIGNGIAGNVGAESIRHVVSNDTGVDRVVNPMPARGGIDPEPIEHARQVAPASFRVQERAVTEADYAEVTERRDDIDRAAATFRWTGSWHTLFDTIDRLGGREVDDPFRADIRQYLERYRVVGHDIEVDPPRFVSLELGLTVCVLAGYFRPDIELAVRDVLTSGTRRNGARGFFHPDNFTFGQPVIMSRIIAAVAAIDGVDSVFVDTFQRQGNIASDARGNGVLPLGRLEIARLENSRDFPEHGLLTVIMRGGV